MKQLTYDEWVSTYKPVENLLRPDADFNGTLFETYGNERSFVDRTMKTDPDKVWTLHEEDGYRWIQPGYHLINRMGFFVTAHCFYSMDLEIPL